MMYMLVLLLVAVEPQTPPFAISLRLATAELKASDPLFVKVLIRNETDQQLIWPAAPDFNHQITLQVRAQGTDKYVPCGTRSAGSEEAHPPLLLASGEVYSAFDVLLPTNRFLQTPEMYELRAVVEYYKERQSQQVAKVYSEPERLRIVSRLAKEQAIIRSMKDEINWGISADFSNGSKYEKELWQIEAALQPSVMRTSAVWSRMVREYHPKLKCADEHLVSIENVRRIVDPLTSEVIGLCLASRLHFLQQWESTLALLEEFEERNATVESLRVECRSRLKK